LGDSEIQSLPEWGIEGANAADLILLKHSLNKRDLEITRLRVGAVHSLKHQVHDFAVG
jgi:hypothetical protein